MKRLLMAVLILLPAMAFGQSGAAPDPFKALSFLEQNWEANTNGYGGVKSTGTYTFRRELGGHILARRSTSDVTCKGPTDFDCGHGDMLYVYQDAPGQPLKAIYFDNEGHVIHYQVSAQSGQATFLSEPGPGPRFRLSYRGVGADQVVTTFEVAPPDHPEGFVKYLEGSSKRGN